MPVDGLKYAVGVIHLLLKDPLLEEGVIVKAGAPCQTNVLMVNFDFHYSCF